MAKNKADSVEQNPEIPEVKTLKVGKAKVRSKKYLQMKGHVDKNKLYSLPEAIKIVKQTSYSKFPGSVELHLVVKKEGFSTQATLPFSAGKQKKVEIANEDTIKKLQADKIDFDILLATADMMPKLVAFARVLGPKGLMPNPRNGTLIKDKSQASRFSGNSVTIKTEKKAPLIHTVAGRVSQEDNEIEANVQAVINAVGTRQILRAYIKPTMGPSVKLQVA